MKNRVTEEMKQEIISRLGLAKETEIIEQDVQKNNGLVLHGVAIRESGTSISPTIYIDDVEDERIVSYLVDVYMKNRKDLPFNLKEMFSRESILAKVQPVLVNREKNEELLKSVPSRWFAGDLAIIYKVIIEDLGGNASVTIKNDLMEKENLSEEELYENALKNLDDKIVVNSMYDTMKKTLLDDCMTRFPDMSTDELDKVVKDMMVMSGAGEEDTTLTVITNKNKYFGAASILDNATLMELRDTFDSDFYILPSSIHEVIVVPTSKGDDVEQFRDMVREVNDTQVAPDEILSYNVYLYSNGKVFVA